MNSIRAGRAPNSHCRPGERLRAEQRGQGAAAADQQREDDLRHDREVDGVVVERLLAQDRRRLVAAFEGRDDEHEGERDQADRAADRDAVVVVLAEDDQQVDRDGHEEAGQAHRDEHGAGHDRVRARAWPAPHQPGRLLVEAERDADRGRDHEVDPEDLDCGEGLPARDVEQARQQEGHDVGDERHHHEADVLEHVVVELAALGDGLHDRREVVVGEDHFCRVLGDLGAGPHRDADVGRLDRRRVVDAVPGHRDHVTLLAQGLDHQDLVLGRHPADDADAVDPGQPLLLRECCEVGAEDRLSLDAELPRDRLAGDHVVAGHHPDADVGVLALRTASFDSARGGSIIPTIAVSCSPVIRESRSPEDRSPRERCRGWPRP